MIAAQFEQLFQPLCEFTRSLMTPSGEKVEIINYVTTKQHILLSITDLNDPQIVKNNPIPVDLFIRNVLLEKAVNEANCQNKEDDVILKCCEEFETGVINHLRTIKKLMAELSFEINKRKALSFVNDFSNGMLMDSNRFMMSLQDMIAYTAINSESKASVLNRISQLLTKLNQPFKDIENGLILEKKIMNIPECIFPKWFEQIDQVVVNTGKEISFTNGIDIHPYKNMYAAIGCSDGDLVIRDQDTNNEICRAKINNNSGSYCQNCLWSPSGNKIMVSTYKNHSIYIYNQTGQKLLQSVKKTYSQDGIGAIWLSEQEVAVGYDDGMVKFFNIDKGIEIKNIKVDGAYAWGMDCADDSHLLVGDYCGSITNINWKNNSIKWIKTGWHSNNQFFCCLKLNQDKTKLLTGSYDCSVKLMRLQDQSKLWEFKLNHYVNGILWVPGGLFVLALSYNNQLVALNSDDGTNFIEFNGLSTNPMSLRLNPRTAEILVGDSNGIIRRLKICQQWTCNQKYIKYLFVDLCILYYQIIMRQLAQRQPIQSIFIQNQQILI